MIATGKVRRSVPISQPVTVNTSDVCVVVEGVDCTGIPSSFTVHLLKEGKRIASSFFLQPSGSRQAGKARSADRLVHFDFVLPIDAVSDGELSVEIEPRKSIETGTSSLFERTGRPTMSVYLMLQSRSV